VLVFALTVMVGGGGRLVWIQLSLGQQSAALQLKLGYVYLAVPLAGACIVFYSVHALADAWRGHAEDRTGNPRGSTEMNEALILALVFAVLLFAGVPISFAIGSAAVAALLMSLDPAAATTVIAQRMATGLDSFALLAIPFFILAGQLMNRGGIARRLIDLAKVIVGRLPGGLAYVNILGSMLFGSISGSAVAAAAAIGGTMSPLMKRRATIGSSARR
jgi:TRAP-type C4-dicarboxylate transport system permease large subunit